MPELSNKPKKFIKIRKINRIVVVLVILGIGIGLLITAQWRTQTLRVSNPVTPYVALEDTRDNLTDEQYSFKGQITSLQSQIKDDQEKLKKYSQSKKKVEELELYKNQVGLTDKQGNGIVITLDDSKSQSIASVDSITHAADIRDIVNFAWSLGAEAISINGERIVLNTSIDCIVNTVLINSTKTSAPFTISIIGDQERLEKEFNNKDNLKDLHKRADTEGIIFEISPTRNIIIPAFDGSFPIKFAKIKE